MSPEAQRIAIAEACNWQPHLNADATFQAWYSRDGEYITSDPLNDLNAMHEAEKVLTTQQQATYAWILHRNSGRLQKDHLGKDFDVLHATAAQRADAFLYAIYID